MTVPRRLTETAACEWLELQAAAVTADQVIVEIGVFQGGSLRYLCDGSLTGEGAQVYGIDPWVEQPKTYADRPRLIHRYGPHNQAIAAQQAPEATLIRDYGASVGACWTGPTVGLLFIDSVHKELNLLADFAAWWPHLAAGATVALDDHCPRFPGVVTAVTRLVDAGRLTTPVMVGDRLATAFCR